MEPSIAASPARPALPAALALIGGLLVAVAGVLTWFQLTGVEGTVAIKGNDFSVGIGTSAIGVISAIAGIIIWFRGPATGAKAWAITVIVLGASIVLIGGGSTFTPETALTNYAAGDVGETLGISETEAKAALENAFETGTLSATAEIGSVLVLGGGLLALVGGIAGVSFAKRRRAAAMPPPQAADGPPATPQQGPPA
jgi:hypothetical protein